MPDASKLDAGRRAGQYAAFRIPPGALAAGAQGRVEGTQRAEEAGGLLYDIGSHLIDQALYLFGPVGKSMPSWITAASRAQ